MPKTSGQAPFAFSLCDDLYSLPEAARPCEVDLHGGFAVDTEPGGRIYYGMPGCGLMSIASDLRSQEIIELPPDLKPINFHSTKLVQFDGKRRLVMPANGDAKVVVLGLDGNLDFVLSRPEFDEYQDAETPFNPTDTAYADGTLYVADGYGANPHFDRRSRHAAVEGHLRRQDRRPEGAGAVRHRARPERAPRRPSPVHRRPSARPLPALWARRSFSFLA